MTEEEKQLLLKDLCARLPYGIKINCFDIARTLESICIDWEGFITIDCGNDHYYHPFSNKLHDGCLPYLRPMSSMTEDEMVDYGRLKLSSDKIYVFSNYRKTGKGFVNIHTVDRETGKETYTFQVNKRTMLYNGYVGIDWLNKKMFDYRGLIPMGLALPALEDMYD